MTIREKTQEIERQTLSPFASLSENTKGRAHAIDECDLRTPYQRDRDRVLHSKAFRRLKHKTQVFLLPKGDHYRTRLTHTLEVSQIARTISRALRLNDDLTEAIALGHDLGHSPFGHAGERALAEVCAYGFKHAQQGVRVVELLENYDRGLNLDFEVIDGIATHMSGAKSATLEGDVVRAADKIAYLNHDIEDAVRAGILVEEELPLGVLQVLGHTRSERITSLIRSVIESSGEHIQMDAEVGAQFKNLRKFLFETVYVHPVAKSEEQKAADLVKRLYEYYVRHIDLLPEEYLLIREREGVERAACDYIAGMTDTFAVDIYQELFVPQTWNRL